MTDQSRDAKVFGETLPLAGAIGLYGLTAAFTNPTASLFLSDYVHATPLLIGLFFMARGVASVFVSQATGRPSDRLRDRRGLIGMSGATGVAAWCCFAFIRNYAVLLVIGVALLSLSMVMFSQLFAYAREYATARGRAVTAFTAGMRSGFSAAWVVGPPAGLFLYSAYGARVLFLATAGLSLATAVIGRWGLPYVPVPAGTTPSRKAASRNPVPSRRGRAWRVRRPALPARLWLLLGASSCLGMVNQIYNIDIALHITKDLHLGAQLAGWMAGLCAAVEIPVMIIAGRYAERAGKGRVVLASTAVATAFFCLLPLAGSAAALLTLMLLNGVWVAIAMSIPMIMVQDEAPGGAGEAVSLYNSTFTTATLVAGAVTGIATSAIGYGDVFWLCAGLSAVAGLLLAARTIAPRSAVSQGAVSEGAVSQGAVPRSAVPRSAASTVGAEAAVAGQSASAGGADEDDAAGEEDTEDAAGSSTSGAVAS